MDIDSEKQLLSFFKKYQYVLLVLLIGIFLMLLPQKTEEQTKVQPEKNVLLNLEEELSVILSKIDGVGKTEVLLTEASGSNTVYQMDGSQNQGYSDTVIIVDENRKETGLVKQIIPPVYKGALVVCQGADSAGVRLAVVDAVKSVTGLSSDCISVLKMK